MGMGLFRSTSKCEHGPDAVSATAPTQPADTPAPNAQRAAPKSSESMPYQKPRPVPTERAPNNPDPFRFSIFRAHEGVGARACAVEVRYPDATNYEGRKVMVYAHPFIVVGVQQKLDPHFCDEADCVSPIARFEPTDRGWSLAIALVDSICSLLAPPPAPSKATPSWTVKNRERLASLKIESPAGHCDGTRDYAYDPDNEWGRGKLLTTKCPGCRACC